MYIIISDPFSRNPFHLAGFGLTSGTCPIKESQSSVAMNIPTNANFTFGNNSTRLKCSHAVITSRKRALSSSPYSDSFDVNSLIRISPNLLGAGLNGSRSENLVSACYGHLSACDFSPFQTAMAPHLHQLQAHLLRVSAGLVHTIPIHTTNSDTDLANQKHNITSTCMVSFFTFTNRSNFGVPINFKI